MTTQPTTSPITDLAAAYENDDTAPLTIEPDQGSRLAELHAAYADAKAANDEAAARLKTITDGIKAELAQVAPTDTLKMELRSDAGPTLSLQHVTSWRLDSKKLKAEHPEIWVLFAKKSGAWTLKPSGGGR